MTQQEVDDFLINTKVCTNGKFEELQRKLLSLGCRWWNYGSTIVDVPYLYINGYSKFLHWDDSYYEFEHSSEREITVDEILNIELNDTERN